MRITSARCSHQALFLAGQLMAAFCPRLQIAAADPTANAAVAPAIHAPFSFIAIGCMPYGRLPLSSAAYGRVLAEINRHNPAFAVHLGDLFGSEEPATDELLTRRRDEFNTVVPPMIYTPGDNEWKRVRVTHRSSYRADPCAPAAGTVKMNPAEGRIAGASHGNG